MSLVAPGIGIVPGRVKMVRASSCGRLVKGDRMYIHDVDAIGVVDGDTVQLSVKTKNRETGFWDITVIQLPPGDHELSIEPTLSSNGVTVKVDLFV
jgi:hypothetical protein